MSCAARENVYFHPSDLFLCIFFFIKNNCCKLQFVKNSLKDSTLVLYFDITIEIVHYGTFYRSQWFMERSFKPTKRFIFIDLT